MKLNFIMVFALALFFGISCSAQEKTKEEVNAYIKEIQELYHIPGLAVAIIKDGKLIHKSNHGLANIEMTVPVTDETLFPLFSTTKVMSVVAVYQLIEQNKISLDNYLSDFLDDLPNSWKRIQVKNLITHSSGLPDIVNYSEYQEEEAKQKVYNDTLKFIAGNQFDYNQTNFWILNRIFQKLVGKTLSEYIIQHQFSFNERSVVFEGNNLKVVENLSYGYIHQGHEFRKRNWSFPEYLYGAAALNMTLNSLIEWNKRFDKNEFISEKSKAQLLAPFFYEIKRDFTYGLDLMMVGGAISYGFSGGLSTAYRTFPNENVAVILLANGQFIPNDKLKGINEVVNNIAKIALKE